MGSTQEIVSFPEATPLTAVSIFFVVVYLDEPTGTERVGLSRNSCVLRGYVVSWVPPCTGGGGCSHSARPFSRWGTGALAKQLWGAMRAGSNGGRRPHRCSTSMMPT